MTLPVRLSPSALHDFLIEACETERRLPPAIRRQSVTFWVDTLPEWLSYADPTTRTTLAGATAEQIGRYDALSTLVLQLNEPDRRLLWATARSAAFRSRPSWSKVGRMLHCDRRKVKRMYLKALLGAVEKWNDRPWG